MGRQIDFSAELDPEQHRAVTTTEGPLLIIAGAGSGKTRVITYRMARLLSLGVPQQAILALTFTNKAAREMAERARALLGSPLRDLVVSTFHAFGAMVLRKEIHRLGWRADFTIYDEQDRLHAVKESARELGLSSDRFDAARAAQAISARKSGLAKGTEEGEADIPGLAAEYERSLRIYNAVDFDDLISKPLEIFEKYPETAQNLRNRFSYVMVDEFQDTSSLQYRLLRAFSPDNICVVGDDDQSIYSWRGADFGNIERFERDYPGLTEIKLERNYRSTSLILDAANALIANNSRRKGKRLWSPGNRLGAPISLTQAEDEGDEAEAIVSRMKRMRIAEGVGWDAFAVLVRTNAQARVIEDALVEGGVPYRSAGGPSFYQRKEVRDMLAYLKAAANPDDDVSVLRIINVPRRGVGRAGLEKIGNFARGRNLSIRGALEQMKRIEDPAAHSRPVAEAIEFMEWLEAFRGRLLSGGAPVSASLRSLVGEIGYWRHLLDEHRSDEKTSAWRYRNVETLAQSMERWERDPDTLDRGLFAYLARVALVTRDDEEDEGGKASLLTVHAAKGLEFDIVFIPGCEEGILPHARSVEEGEGDVEEERRLFYVALTRARKRIILSRCARRSLRSQAYEPKPSPFLAELPQELLLDGEGHDGGQPRDEAEIRKEAFARMKAIFSKEA